MRIAGALLAVGLVVRATVAAEEFPYQATVAHEAALVRSGPGESFYPTCRLVRGAAVEVHRHGPNGWCAIRPPDQEFSLIATGDVQLLPGDDLAEVTAGETTVWIGSHLAKPEQHRWQIHLQRGEKAIVLGVRAGEGNDPTSWYKIAPPAGEFRWIPSESLARQQEQAKIDVAEDAAQPGAQEAAQPTAHEILPSPDLQVGGVVQASFEEPVRAEDGNESQEAPAGGPREVTPENPGTALEEPRVVPSQEFTAGKESPVMLSEASAPQKSPQPGFVEADRRVEMSPRPVIAPDAAMADSNSAPVIPPEQFDAEAAAVQLELTLVVAQDLSRWRLGPLRDRTVRLLNSAPDAAAREHAQRLLESISRFEQLYARYRQFAQGRTTTALRDTIQR